MTEQNIELKKICPFPPPGIMLERSVENAWECVGEKCSWWTGGMCAVVDIAESIRRLAEKP